MGSVYKRKRRLKSGNLSTSRKWWIEYVNASGRRVRKAASTDKKLAQRMLREIENQVEAERLGLGSAPLDISIKDLAQQFLDNMELHLRPRTLQDYKTSMDKLFLGKSPAFRVKKASQLTPAIVQQWQAKARKNYSARTVNKKTNLISAMLNWGVQSGLLSHNPMGKVRRLPAQPERVQRALKDEEVKELLLAADEETRGIWLFFLETGMRKGEVAKLLWDDVDFDNDVIHVRAAVAKSKKSRQIPMRKNVRKVLEDQQEKATGKLVFPTIRGRGFYNYALAEFDQDLEAANIDKKGAHIHCLRRTFATRLIKAGADPKTVQTLLGHSTLELTLQLYTDAKALNLRGWMDQLPDLEVNEPISIYGMQQHLCG